MRKSYCRSSLSVKNPGDSPAVEPVSKPDWYSGAHEDFARSCVFLAKFIDGSPSRYEQTSHTEDNVNSVHKEDFK